MSFFQILVLTHWDNFCSVREKPDQSKVVIESNFIWNLKFSSDMNNLSEMLNSTTEEMIKAKSKFLGFK